MSRGAKELCKSITANTDYVITLNNPKFRLSVLPTLGFEASGISAEQKSGSDSAEIKNFKIVIRLLPLISGRLHINYIGASSISVSSTLKEKVELDKDFFSKLETSKIKLDSAKIDSFEFLMYQKDVKQPISYSGMDFFFLRKNRFLRFETHNQLKIQDKTSNTDINLYLPKNNDIKKTVFDVHVSNLDLAPLRIYFINYLPKELVSLNGTINL